jgi:hypothetical protein
LVAAETKDQWKEQFFQELSRTKVNIESLEENYGKLLQEIKDAKLMVTERFCSAKYLVSLM